MWLGLHFLRVQVLKLYLQLPWQVCRCKHLECGGLRKHCKELVSVSIMSIGRRSYPTARAATTMENDFILVIMVSEVIVKLAFENWVADVNLNDVQKARGAVR